MPAILERNGTVIFTRQRRVSVQSGRIIIDYNPTGNNNTSVNSFSYVTPGDYGPSVVLAGNGNLFARMLVNTVYDLQNLQNNALGFNFILNRDIDASVTAGWNGGQGFAPLGYFITIFNQAQFTGTFDGQNHTITNLTINRSSIVTSDYLAGSSAARCRIGLTNANVKEAITGALYELDGGAPHTPLVPVPGTVQNAYATGVVSGNTRWSGWAHQRQHYNKHSDAIVCQRCGRGDTNVGGLVGKIMAP